MLNEKGFTIVPPTKFVLKNIQLLNKVTNNLLKKEGNKGGWEGKEKYYKRGKYLEHGVNRLGNLVDKHKVFRELILMPEILAASYEVIKSDIKIGGVDLRNPQKNFGFQGSQRPPLCIQGFFQVFEKTPDSLKGPKTKKTEKDPCATWHKGRRKKN